MRTREEIASELRLFRARLKKHKNKEIKGKLSDYYAEEHFLEYKVKQLFEELTNVKS